FARTGADQSWIMGRRLLPPAGQIPAGFVSRPNPVRPVVCARVLVRAWHRGREAVAVYRVISLRDERGGARSGGTGCNVPRGTSCEAPLIGRGGVRRGRGIHGVGRATRQ